MPRTIPQPRGFYNRRLGQGLTRRDPTRTATLRKIFSNELRRRMSRLFADSWKLLEDNGLTENAFCPTGPGGGVDPTCSPDQISIQQAFDRMPFGDNPKGYTWASLSLTTLDSLLKTGKLGLIHDVGELSEDSVLSKVNSKKLNPLIVTKIGQRFLVVDGNHSLEAARRLRVDSVKAIVPKKSLLSLNAFCPTGKGGGQDNSCSPSNKGMSAPFEAVMGHWDAMRSKDAYKTMGKIWKSDYEGTRWFDYTPKPGTKAYKELDASIKSGELVREFEERFASEDKEVMMIIHPSSDDMYNRETAKVSVYTSSNRNEVTPHDQPLSGRILTHNHPDGANLSLSDVKTAVRKGVQEIRAVTPDGTVYSLKKAESYYKKPDGTQHKAVRGPGQDAIDKRLGEAIRKHVTLEEAQLPLGQQQAIYEKVWKAFTKEPFVSESAEGGQHYTRYEYTVSRRTENVFCPTGPGGGVDPTCSPSNKGTANVPQTPEEWEEHFQHINFLGTKRVVEDRAKEWKYHAPVNVENAVGRNFERGGVQWEEGGNCQLETGVVTIYSRSVGSSVENVERITNHELMHGTFEKVYDKYRRELGKITIDHIHMDGTLKAEHFNEFPTYGRIQALLENHGQFSLGKALQKEDGITDYSRAYWKDYEEGKVSYHIAVHETLAEIAAIHGTTGVIQGEKVWRDLYKGIRDEYRVLQGHQSRRRGPGIPKPVKNYSTETVYLDGDFRRVPPEQAVFIHWWDDAGSHWGTRKPPTNNFASTQFNVDEVGVLTAVHVIQSHLDSRDVLELETQPHITVRYGLHDQEASGVRALYDNQVPVRVKLGGLSLFQTPKADVLKIDVDSRSLPAIHGRLGLLPHTSTFPTYIPHLTVAYLRPGTGHKYVGKSGLEGTVLTFDKLVFSDDNRRQTTVSNAFCPTGPGGGQDNSCPPNRQAESSSLVVPVRYTGKKGTPVEVVHNPTEKTLKRLVKKERLKGLLDLKNGTWHFWSEEDGEHEDVARGMGLSSGNVFRDGIEYVRLYAIKDPLSLEARIATASHVDTPLPRTPFRVHNAFCPTGPGGGVDPTCSPKGGSSPVTKAIREYGPVLAESRQGGYTLRVHDENPKSEGQPAHISDEEKPFSGAGRMTIESPDGELVIAGKWMDWAEVHYPSDYTKLPKKDRAALEAQEQLKYDLQKNFHFHKERGGLVANTYDPVRYRVSKFVKEFTARVKSTVKDKPWWVGFINSGYQTGVGRAYDDLNKPALMTPEERKAYQAERRSFVRGVVKASGPTAQKLYASVEEDIDRITSQLGDKLRVQLKQALAEGLSLRKVAKGILAKVEEEGLRRATNVANYRTVEAHNEGQLAAFEDLGVTDIGVLVEWTVAGNPCPLCKPMAGVVLRPKDAHGLIPRHVHCQCCFEVVGSGFGADKEDLIVDRSGIRKAIKKSISRERKQGTWKDKLEATQWKGRSVRVEGRPLFNEEASPALRAFSQFVTSHKAAQVEETP